MTSIRMTLGYAAVIGAALVVLTGILVARPFPRLDWEGRVVPLAYQYAAAVAETENATTAASLNDETTRIATTNDRQETPLKGRVVLVTGATSGLGLEISRSMYRLGATVIALGRSESKLQALQDELPLIQPVLADIMDLNEVRKAAQEIRATHTALDFLINNAGITDLSVSGNNLVTPQGYDAVFAVNYLSHFLLTEELAPLLHNAARPVVMQISSSAHWSVNGERLMPTADGEGPLASRPIPPLEDRHKPYGNSKLAQILHARAIKRHQPLLKKARIVSVCPGWAATGIIRDDTKLDKLLHRFAFPADGWGLASFFEAVFSNDDNPGHFDFYYNSKLFVSYFYWCGSRARLDSKYVFIVSRKGGRTIRYSNFLVPAPHSHCCPISIISRIL
jgi:NAD(P)-dependent dehydrogenase (short-subunit alcohol dehydrogenase family)